mgnify:CR=1 FL=1
MDFIERIKMQARKEIKTIILPETEDIRVLKGAEIVLSEKTANIILLGNEDEIKKLAMDNNIKIDGCKIINPLLESDKLNYYAEELYNLRKNKGMTKEEAINILKTNSRYFATMMVKLGDADGYVSGASHPTSDTLKPVLQIIKGKEGVKTVSAFFIMCLPTNEFGENGVFIYADSGMNENPNEEQLADIAITSSKSFKELVNPDGIPKVAMLSYSTKGSAHSELTEKVVKATQIAHSKDPDLLLDGELQLDAAIIPEVAKMKAPDSPIKGEANILVFPDLNAGNIGYKLTQRLAHAKAYGPLCQGLAKPVNDLSRGCSAEDIAGVVAITCIQAQNMGKEN